MNKLWDSWNKGVSLYIYTHSARRTEVLSPN